MSMQMKNEISVGSHVTVKWGSEQVSGTITNCRREKAHYIIGIKRDPDDGDDKN
jgi:primosomal protein N'